MSEIHRALAEALNRAITNRKFIDRENGDYLYVSLTQPPIKVVDRHNSDDELDWTVECPNCGRKVDYGHEIFMVSGHIYCSDEKCKKEVYRRAGVVL